MDVVDHPRFSPAPATSRREASFRRRAPGVCAGVMLTALAATTGCAKPSAAPPPRQAPGVSVATVEQKDVPIFGDWVGTLDGYTNAMIQPQVSGYLIRQDYREGSVVHTGQVLFEIDPRPLQAILDQAKGQLAQANANLGLANINVKRDTPLAQARAIARSQLDNDVQQQAASEATARASQASVEQAQLNLGFTKVRSLLNGVAGQAATQVGSLVSPSTVLTTVSQVQPIKVYFAISEQEYLALSRQAKARGASDLLHSSSRVPIQLTLSNGGVYPEKGYVVFVDRAVNAQTGTIRIAAAFPNRQSLLRPGQYGRVRAQTDIHRDAMLVPQRAVTELQGNYQVAVVDTGNKVHIQKVEVGQQVGQDWLITSGLKPGERVVTEGNGKLAEGMTVKPTADQTPQPAAVATKSSASEGQ
ncbi:MAG: efflux RND transporter periplasmic adaptor subunit [Acidobacteriaceae bacterium]